MKKNYIALGIFCLTFIAVLMQVEASTKRPPFPNKPIGNSFTALQEDKIMREFVKKIAGKSKSNHHQNNKKQRDQPLDWKTELSTFITSLMDCPQNQFPGLAISIVQGTEVIFQQGFGVKDIQTQSPVDKNTLFGIGSCTKAFTSTAMAILMDKGLLNVDQPLNQQLLPNFRLYDEFATMRVTTRDLASHKTGVPRNDVLWVSGTPKELPELVNDLRYLPPNYDFRFTFEYNNFMVATAGYLVSQLTGVSWNNFIQQAIFKPLQMTESTTDVEKAIKTNNYAFPYGLYSNGTVGGYPHDINKIVSNLCPAGCIISSASDMSNWMIMHLNGGNFSGNPIVSEQSLSVTYAPSNAIGQYSIFEKPTFPVGVTLGTYGMGWEQGTYRDEYFISHDGNVIGHSALVALFPSRNLGITILTNMEAVTLAGYLIAFYAADLIIGYDPWLSPSDICEFPCQYVHCPKEEEDIERADEYMDEFGSIDFDANEFVGSYVHPAYGTVNVSVSASGNITWNLNSIYSETTYLGDDFFIGYVNGPFLLEPTGPLVVPFYRNLNGLVDSIALYLEPTTPPILFTNENYQETSCGFPAFTPYGKQKSALSKEMRNINL